MQILEQARPFQVSQQTPGTIKEKMNILNYIKI